MYNEIPENIFYFLYAQVENVNNNNRIIRVFTEYNNNFQ